MPVVQQLASSYHMVAERPRIPLGVLMPQRRAQSYGGSCRGRPCRKYETGHGSERDLRVWVSLACLRSGGRLHWGLSSIRTSSSWIVACNFSKVCEIFHYDIGLVDLLPSFLII